MIRHLDNSGGLKSLHRLESGWVADRIGGWAGPANRNGSRHISRSSSAMYDQFSLRRRVSATWSGLSVLLWRGGYADGRRSNGCLLRHGPWNIALRRSPVRMRACFCQDRSCRVHFTNELARGKPVRDRPNLKCTEVRKAGSVSRYRREDSPTRNPRSAPRWDLIGDHRDVAFVGARADFGYLGKCPDK